MFWWLVVAVVLVIAELLTGSLYLLALAAGAGVAAALALTGVTLNVQIAIASIVAVLGVGWVSWRRSKMPKEPDDEANPALHIDVGAQVFVSDWGPDGHARVMHRGSEWDAILDRSDVNGQVNEDGWYVIKAIRQNQLVLAKA